MYNRSPVPLEVHGWLHFSRYFWLCFLGLTAVGSGAPRTTVCDSGQLPSIGSDANATEVVRVVDIENVRREREGFRYRLAWREVSRKKGVSTMLNAISALCPAVVKVLLDHGADAKAEFLDDARIWPQIITYD